MSKESFEVTQQRVNRLLEIAGGSIDAYEKPLPQPAETPVDKTPTPDHKPSWDEVCGVLKSEGFPVPEPAGEEKLFDEPAPVQLACSQDIEAVCIGEGPEVPSPISAQYEHAGQVYAWKETGAIWTGFCLNAAHCRPVTVKLESGSAQIHLADYGQWVLIDKGKNIQYVRDTQAYQRFPEQVRSHDLFVWVQRVQTKANLGYLLNVQAYLAKKEGETQ